ncbi:unnamed protein product, partial [Closterium sp. Naga37s-1]
MSELCFIINFATFCTAVSPLRHSLLNLTSCRAQLVLCSFQGNAFPAAPELPSLLPSVPIRIPEAVRSRLPRPHLFGNKYDLPQAHLFADRSHIPRPNLPSVSPQRRVTTGADGARKLLLEETPYTEAYNSADAYSAAVLAPTAAEVPASEVDGNTIGGSDDDDGGGETMRHTSTGGEDGEVDGGGDGGGGGGGGVGADGGGGGGGNGGGDEGGSSEWPSLAEGGQEVDGSEGSAESRQPATWCDNEACLRGALLDLAPTVYLTRHLYLTNGELPAVRHAVAVTGLCSSDQCTIDGQGQSRIFTVRAGGYLALQNIALLHGFAPRGKFGGAIFVSGLPDSSPSPLENLPGAYLSAISTSFFNNSGGSGGGAVAIGSNAAAFFHGANFAFNSVFMDATNKHRSRGGAMYLGEQADRSIKPRAAKQSHNGTTPSKSTGSKAVACSRSALPPCVTVLDSLFVANSAAVGGAVFVDGSDPACHNTTASQQDDTALGASLHMSNGLLEANRAAVDGGAAAVGSHGRLGGQASFSTVRFNKNSARRDGGALFVGGGRPDHAGSTVTVYDAAFLSNTAGNPVTKPVSRKSGHPKTGNLQGGADMAVRRWASAHIHHSTFQKASSLVTQSASSPPSSHPSSTTSSSSVPHNFPSSSSPTNPLLCVGSCIICQNTTTPDTPRARGNVTISNSADCLRTPPPFTCPFLPTYLKAIPPQSASASAPAPASAAAAAVSPTTPLTPSSTPSTSFPSHPPYLLPALVTCGRSFQRSLNHQ